MSRRSHWSFAVAGVASVVGLLSLWLPWYGLSLPGVSGSVSQAKSLGPFGLLTVMMARKLAALHIDAWQALHGWPAIFAAGAVVAGAVAILRATGRDVDRRLGWVAAAGALAATLFAAYEIADPTGNSGVALIHIRFGAFLSVLAAVTALVATVVAQLDRMPAALPVSKAPAPPPAERIASPAASASVAPPGW